MAERILVFDPRGIGDLLTHYTSGVFPLGAKILNVMVADPSAAAMLGQIRFDRHIALLVESDQWQDEDVIRGSDATDAAFAGATPPLHIRYEGRRTLSWGNKHAEVAWKDSDNFADRRGDR